jgi:phage shock protein C
MRIIWRKIVSGPHGILMPPLTEGPMYCNYCGKVISDDSSVCAYCGKRVAGVVARERLVRPRLGRKIAGVCLGFAEYFDLDVSLVRIVWAITAIFGLFGLVTYFAAWVVLPEEPLLLASPEARQDRVVNT